MKYYANRDNLIALLRQRPALVVNIPDITVQFVVDAIYKHATDILQYLPAKLRYDQAVYKARLLTNNIKSNELRSDPIRAVCKILNPEERLVAIEKTNGWIAPCLEDMTQSEAHYILIHNSELLEHIPDLLIDHDLIARVVTNPDVRLFDIPEKYFADPVKGKTLAMTCVARDPDYVQSIIPPQCIDRDVLTACLKDDVRLPQGIPESSWTQDLAQKAIECSQLNIEAIPKQFLTEDLCVQAADHGYRSFDPDLLTDRVLASCLANCHNKAEELSRINDPTFQLLVARYGRKGMVNLTSYKASITHETWIEAIKINPECILAVVPKDQTNEMVDAFITHASIEAIDKFCDQINIGKIKKCHAPLLLGCKKDRILTCIEKFLSPPEPTPGSVAIDLSPGVYAEVRSTLERSNKS